MRGLEQPREEMDLKPMLAVKLEEVEPKFRVVIQQVAANHMRKWTLLLSAFTENSEMQIHHNMYKVMQSAP